MKCELLKLDRMNQSGKSLLRLMQSNNIPTLDLLVRESIQNSLDAQINCKTDVNVDFSIGSFETKNISGFFECIGTVLDSKYPGQHDYIAIRDSGTVGLNGTVRQQNGEHSNFVKLVYEISQTNADGSEKGGSWGLGKTTYFRVGIGMVIYYTKVKTKTGKYESRLAATLVEDESKPGTLVKDKAYYGVAWWGDLDIHNPGKTIPVTSEREIEKILKGFGIKPYEGDETGTTILIPYISSSKLINQVRNDYPWTSSVEEYMKVCIPRWYVPRMSNKTVAGNRLKVSINNKVIEMSSIAPIFSLIQFLYKMRPDASSQPKHYMINDSQADCWSKEINTRSVLDDETAGWLNYALVDRDFLKMNYPDNLASPFDYVGIPNVTDNVHSIVLMTRKPGLVISYNIDGPWLRGVRPVEDGKYLIAIFVANSNNSLSSSKKKLEEYLRSCEDAKHNSWNESANSTEKIVHKIISGVTRELSSNGNEKKVGQSLNDSLGSLLASKFMPPQGFSVWDNARGGSKGVGGSGGNGVSTTVTTTSGSKKKGQSAFKVVLNGSPYFDEELDCIWQPIKICFGCSKTGQIELCVLNESQKEIKASSWENEVNGFGKAFPLELCGLSIENKKRLLEPSTEYLLVDDVLIRFKKSKKGVFYSLQLRLAANSPLDNTSIDANLKFRIHQNVVGTIVSQEEIDEK